MAMTGEDSSEPHCVDGTVDPSHLVIVSGCSGGGKSALLAEMASRGYDVSTEVGREIVKEQLRTGGRGLPWEDALLFVELAANRAAARHREGASRDGPVLFDRSVIDVVSYLDFKGLKTPQDLSRLVEACRYAQTVFMTPPWPEIFRSEAERPKGFEEAVSEYRALVERYRALGYRITDIPKAPVDERADFLEKHLAAGFRQSPDS